MHSIIHDTARHIKASKGAITEANEMPFRVGKWIGIQRCFKAREGTEGIAFDTDEEMTLLLSHSARGCLD